MEFSCQIRVCADLHPARERGEGGGRERERESPRYELSGRLLVPQSRSGRSWNKDKYFVPAKILTRIVQPSKKAQNVPFWLLLNL